MVGRSSSATISREAFTVVELILGPDKLPAAHTIGVGREGSTVDDGVTIADDNKGIVDVGNRMMEDGVGVILVGVVSLPTGKTTESKQLDKHQL